MDRWRVQREATRQGRPIWYFTGDTHGCWVYPTPRATGRELSRLIRIIRQYNGKGN